MCAVLRLRNTAQILEVEALKACLFELRIFLSIYLKFRNNCEYKKIFLIWLIAASVLRRSATLCRLKAWKYVLITEAEISNTQMLERKIF